MPVTLGLGFLSLRFPAMCGMVFERALRYF